MPAALYPDPSPLPKTSSPWGFYSIPFTHQTMLPGSWERGGHGEGTWIWGSGKRALTGRSLWKPPYPSQILQVGERKGYPI